MYVVIIIKKNKNYKRLMLVILNCTFLNNVDCLCSLLGQELEPPETLEAYLCLYRDSFTFIITFTNFPGQKAQ
jgi:hypothetical protein